MIEKTRSKKYKNIYSVPLSDAVAKTIDAVANKEEASRSDVLRGMLKKGLEEYLTLNKTNQKEIINQYGSTNL